MYKRMKINRVANVGTTENKPVAKEIIKKVCFVAVDYALFLSFFMLSHMGSGNFFKFYHDPFQEKR